MHPNTKKNKPIKPYAMEYSFFLFCKLFDYYHTTNMPYDYLYGEVVNMYHDFLSWDVETNMNKHISEYDAMCEYLATHAPTFENETI